MEKFSSWRDKATGVSPFIPVQFPLAQEHNIIQKVGSIIFKSISFIIKLPFFVILGLLYYLTSIKFTLEVIILSLFGFNDTNISVDGVKRSNTEEIENYKPIVGDIIITNYLTPIDGLIYHLISNVNSWKSIKIFIPDFNTKKVYQYSVWTLIGFTFTSIHNESAIVKDFSSLDLSNSVNFFLLEGATSNNKALLPFINIPEVSSLLKKSKVKSVVIKLQPASYTLPIPGIYSKFYYLFELLSNLSRSGNIKVKIYKFDTFDEGKIRASFQLNNLPLISNNLNVEEKKKFIDYYLNYNLVSGNNNNKKKSS
ncbi:uncharacterized protein RJT21DRAFT_122552 [Scheffersomyces amazonensis]|uniref:uncharacterized protein n=1 Tax=Scheffersomyces amazonensis TaxID=1078765 RepID=UPI00315C95ED